VSINENSGTETKGDKIANGLESANGLSRKDATGNGKGRGFLSGARKRAARKLDWENALF